MSTFWFTCGSCGKRSQLTGDEQGCPKCGKPFRTLDLEKAPPGPTRPIRGQMLSEAVGVHPTQVREAIESARRRGVPTDFTPDGRAVFTGRDHRKRYCKAYGFVDRDGGYGDP